jgi:L-2,4-diaminobutyrate decarboxylase
MDALKKAYDTKYLEENLAAVAKIAAEEVDRAQRREGKVLVQKSIPEIARELDFERVIEQGNGDLPALARVFLQNCNHLHNPRYMGHQVAVPMLPSSIGDFLGGVVNNGMAVYEMGPAGTAIERGLIRWMLRKVGAPWEAGGDGILTHGGSLANLSCLLAARAKVIPDCWSEGTPPGYVILASEASHYSVARAASILGFGSKAVVKIPADRELRISIDGVKAAYTAARSDNKRVLAVVVNAGATPTGIFDPLRPIGQFCRDEALWLHVDGAHGASALVSPRYRQLLDGLVFADSLAWDMHKLLGTSTLCAAALVRDKRMLAGSYAQHAPYLFTDAEKPGEDLSKLTFECTKASLALKLFFNLAVIGEQGMAAHVEKLFDNTRAFYEQIKARKGFETGHAPQSNILCFRFGKNSELQDRVRQQLVMNGDFYITRATLHGESYLRTVFMNPFTTTDDVAALCVEIERLAAINR